MNFQTVLASKPNKVQIFGILTEIAGAQSTEKGALYAQCKIRDDTGKAHTVRIYQGNGILPTLPNLNQRLQFTISAYDGQSQHGAYVGYSGFWNNQAQVAPQASQSAPAAAPAASNLPQAGQAPTSVQNTPQANKDDYIKRGNALNAIMSATRINPMDIGIYLQAGVIWIETGVWNVSPPDNSVPDDGDIPF